MNVNSSPEKVLLEGNLRPQTWDEYIGQSRVKKNLQIIIEAAKQRGDSLEHLLFYGNPGLGKTTLAQVVAHTMEGDLKICSAPTLEKTGDVASLLTNLKDGDILFMDECHRLHKSVMETLYSAMEDFKLHIIMGRGPMARAMELNLPKFTLIGATTRMALLPAPFRNRFGAIFQLNFYENKDIEAIVQRSSNILGIPVEAGAIQAIATRARFTPRVANRILKRVRDYATIEANEPRITQDVALRALEFLEIDELGLEAGDRKILETMVNKFEGGPVGIQTLAAAAAEEPDTIYDVYEPYLLQLGFIERTPRGRVVAPIAYKHLGIQQSQKELL